MVRTQALFPVGKQETKITMVPQCIACIVDKPSSSVQRSFDGISTHERTIRRTFTGSSTLLTCDEPYPSAPNEQGKGNSYYSEGDETYHRQSKLSGSKVIRGLRGKGHDAMFIEHSVLQPL